VSLKDFLVKAKLVEPDEPVAPNPVPPIAKVKKAGDEMLVIDMEPLQQAPGQPSPAAIGPAATSGGEEAVGEIAENTPLDSIYAVFGVPATAFPAERLLKVLDGLRAMDATNQRAAVAAMDAADDSWTLDDVMADAARKISALKTHIGKLNAAVASVQAQETAQKAALARDYDALRATIADQIAQLQEAAQMAASENANAIAALEAKSLAAVSASGREQVRIQAEIDRLDSIAQQFGHADS
jgi:hypothetical protein